MVNGLLLINKPAGLTSHDVVEVIRRKLGVQRVGHAGTLDPMAQGLLLLLVGSATTYQRIFQGHDKTYDAVLQLGTQTDTGDATGTPVRTAPVPPLETRDVAAILASFEGERSQTPPVYSAVKVRGRPAYWWTRRHQPVVLAPRMIRIVELSLVRVAPGMVTFRVQCSAGTYVRTLAEAIAERLGTVGHLTSLVRLSVGRWHVEEALSLDWIAQASSEALAHRLQPATEAGHPAIGWVADGSAEGRRPRPTR